MPSEKRMVPGVGCSAEFQSRLATLENELGLLQDKPEETAETTLKALWITAAGSPISAERAATHSLPDLDSKELDVLDGLIERRLSGVPLGHITERQMFLGVELQVGSEALLPRRETEILARAAGKVVASIVEKQGGGLMIDTCCGCGNVSLAVAHGEPMLRVIGVDLSEQGVRLAQANSLLLGLRDRVEFRTGDLLEPIRDVVGMVDLITCNPPYISSSKVEEMAPEISDFEPRLAFDGGPFGVKILRRLLNEGPSALKPGGHIAFEVGLGQGESMLSRVRKSEVFASSEAFRDSSGAIRAVVAQIE